MNQPKSIIIAPLDWGLGHATRCIPLIRALQRLGYKIVIASSGRALRLLRTRFPELYFEDLPAYGIRYPFSNMMLNMSIQLPRILVAACREHYRMRRLVKKYGAQIVISDNRFGCFVPGTLSIYLTHQLYIPVKSKWVANLVSWFHQRIVVRYDQCWIPDLPPPQKLSGQLSAPSLAIPKYYLGILSDLGRMKAVVKYRAIAILSGPEPQRSQLEKLLLDQFLKMDGQFLMVLGKPEEPTLPFQIRNVQIIPFMGSRALEEAISQSAVVVCRSGYSSVMDLIGLRKKAVFIPTPRQPEQEYLATQIANMGPFVMQRQDSIDLKAALATLEDHTEKLEINPLFDQAAEQFNLTKFLKERLK